MKTRRKIIWTFCVGLFLVVSVSAGVIWYAYSHPLLIKTWVEEWFSRSFGATLSVGKLEYSFEPLRIAAKGVRFSSGEKLKGFDFTVPDFSATFFLEGPFGNRVLVCKSITLHSFSGHMGSGANFLQGDNPSFVSSSGGGILSRIISIVLFKNVKIQQIEIVNGQMVYDAEDLHVSLNGIQSNLYPDHTAELSCGIEAGLPAKKMKLTIPQASLKTDGPVSFSDSGMVCLLNIENAGFESPEGTIHDLIAKAKLFYDHPTGKLSFSGLKVASEKVVVKEAFTEEEIFSGFSLDSDGEIDLKGRSLRADPVELNLTDLLHLKGKLRVGLGTPRRFESEVSEGRIFPERLLPLIAGKIAPLSATFSGPISLGGDVDGLEEGGKWVWDCGLNASFEENRVSLVRGNRRFQGKLTGEAKANGRYPNIEEAVRLHVQDASFSGNGVLLEPIDATVDFSVSHAQCKMNELFIRIPHAGISSGKNAFALSDVTLKAREGSFNVDTESFSFPEVFFDSSLLKNIRLFLKSDQNGTAVSVTGKQTGLLQSAGKLGWLSPDWTFGGKDRLEIKVDLKKSGECLVTSQAVFQETSFQSPDGDHAGDKISLTWQMRGKTDLSLARIAFDTSIALEKGEALWGRFYLSFTDHPMKVHCDGLYKSAGRNLRLSNSAFSLQGILGAKMDGDLFKGGYGQGLDLRLTIPVTPVEPLFRNLVKEPFRMEKPFLAGLELKGQISANLRLKTDSVDHEVKGRVLWREGLLSSPDHGLLLRDVDLSVPVWYRSKEGRDRSPERMEGNLHMGSMKIPFLPEQPLGLKLMAGPDRIFVDTPTVLMVPGGEVRISPIRIQNVFGSDLSMNTGIAMDDLSLEPILTGLWPNPVKGSLSGTLEPIQFKKGTLSTEGELTAHVFGGEMVLSHAGASGLFGPAPVFRIDARWRDLQLLELTAGTPFGEIEGVLNGYADHIEISNGQLQRFNLLLETTKKKGVSQKISVKAVDNIAQLGGGQSPFVGIAGIFMSFFKQFPYDKIGIRASLENDAFRINGTIKDGGKEYLIKRGFFSGVDVINQNTDNDVSFKDMLSRIKRITAAKGAPVIQ